MPVKLKNRTIYMCEYCGKKYLSYSGCAKHEKKFCKDPESPHVKNCEHKEVATAWSPIQGEENRLEPDYDYCVECGLTF